MSWTNFSYVALFTVGASLAAECSSFSIKITAPASGTAVDANGTFTPVFSASSASGAVQYTCSSDFKPAFPCTSDQQYSADDLRDGFHTFTVHGSDESNHSDSDTIALEVDTTAPRFFVNHPLDQEGYTSPADVQVSVDMLMERGAFLQCRFDSQPYGPCPFTSRTRPGPQTTDYIFTYYGNSSLFLANGAHTVTVRATDALGNSSSQTRRFTIEAPAVTVAPPVVSGNCVTVAFSVLADANNIRCQLDSTSSFACASGHTQCGLSDGAHRLTVQATSTSGDIGMGAAEFRVGSSDASPPAVSITLPAPDARFFGQQCARLSYRVNESKTTEKCRLDAGPWVSCSTVLPCLPSLPGAHRITVQATDSAGNTGEATTTYQVAQVDISLPVHGSVIEGDSVSVQFSTTYDPGTFQYNCSVDEVEQSCSSGQVFSSLSDGFHTIRVRQIGQNAVGSIDSVTILVDKPPLGDAIAPRITITSPANGSVVPLSLFVPISFKVNEVAITTECQLDSGAWWSCSTFRYLDDPFTTGLLRNLTRGSHTVRVRATDAAMNVGTAESQFTY